MPKFIISSSLLAADFARLGAEAEAVLTAGADMLHFDVMDNHFVPNLTVGPLVCASLVKYGIKAPIDVHLMVEPVDTMIDAFAKAGATYISFHPEASLDVKQSIELIRKHGCKVGLAINPETELSVLEEHWDKLDLILMMSVNPGFGGQAFLPASLKKLTRAREMINASGKKILLCIDGGIKIDNIAEAAKAGADMFVAGSAIFTQPDYAAVINAMRAQLSSLKE
jgi:ribulose-phosphate 3-epimerase